ncbi:MAG: protein kinase [Paludisphaera borealis]|uniref:protein kinase domain-containing protein n=1 Tax=Paludisphaera borealis TaxID=1387353 RepID=UPI0028483DDB|nr:protein kinase [Paludisphaera borealis]MDR3618287.1 protein kinase [Paludisphaera borealis]
MNAVRGVGDWIGDRFEIFAVHEGGMSLVYVVNDHLGHGEQSVVALKTLKDELLGHRVRRSRFATECRLWVQLGQHKNIVQAHAVEIFGFKPYVMIELVRGGDLSAWIGTPKLDLPQALRFGIQFCNGMEHALRQGLHCHRDVKPGNLLVTQSGVLKITDFGLARVCEEMIAVRSELPDGSIPLDDRVQPPQRIVWSDSRDQTVRPIGSGPASPSLASRPPRDAPVPTTVDKETSEEESPATQGGEIARLTHTGAKLGTGAYMAPEQFRDPASVDVRADIYAFGVVLYEMLTGELPFKGKSLAALDRQHSSQPSPSAASAVPRPYKRLAGDVDAVIQRCLMKDPGRRYPTILDLRAALRDVYGRVTGK